MNEVTLTLTQEQLSDVALVSLLDSYENVMAVEPDDKIVKHLKKVIRFYMTTQQWEEFVKNKETLNG